MNNKDYHLTDTFCLYCQKEFGTNKKLINHIKTQHFGTYAYYSYVPKQDQVDHQ